MHQRFSLELIVAVALTLAVAAGLIAAGGSGRVVEVAILLVAVVFGALTGWPTAGYIAIGTAAAYLILETLFGRLDGAHAVTQLFLTVGVAGAVLTAGLAQSGSRPRIARRRPAKRRVPPALVAEPEPEPAKTPTRQDAPEPDDHDLWADPWVDEVPGAQHLIAGTLDYEIERARRYDRPLSVLAIRPDELGFLGAAGEEHLARLLDHLDQAIEATVRAIDVVGRPESARFQVILPETGPEGARTVAERIRLRIDSTRPELAPAQPIEVSVSIGVAAYPSDGTDEIELDTAAARALTRAAELGGNRTVLHSVPAGAPPGWGLIAAAGTTPLQRRR